jgi:hypothetical protein
LAKLTAMANMDDIIDLNGTDGDSHPKSDLNLGSTGRNLGFTGPSSDMNLNPYPKLSDESIVSSVINDIVTAVEDTNINMTDKNVSTNIVYSNGEDNSINNINIKNTISAKDNTEIIINLNGNNNHTINGNIDNDIDNIDKSEMENDVVHISEKKFDINLNIGVSIDEYNIDNNKDQIIGIKPSPLTASGVIPLCGWELKTTSNTSLNANTFIPTTSFSPIKSTKHTSLYPLSSPFNKTSPFKSSKTSLIKSNVKLNQELPSWIDSRRYPI